MAMNSTSAARKVKRTDLVKDVSRAPAIIDTPTTHFNQDQYRLYFPKSNLLQRHKVSPYYHKKAFIEVPLMHPQADGIAIKKGFIDKGAERAAFEMTEVNIEGEPIGQPLVGKFSLNEEPQMEFHLKCAKTQNEASRLAKVFNERLDQLHLPTRRVEFLEVWFYTWNITELSGLQAILCERRLDNDRYKKFNDNKGGVVNVNNTGQKAALFDHTQKVEFVQETSVMDREVHRVASTNIIDEDIPQAFSHWTYCYTKGDSLVCDLQGVLGRNFSFTDPAINSSHKEQFGSTDRGKAGQRAFFHSHICNPLCHALRLAKKTQSSHHA